MKLSDVLSITLAVVQALGIVLLADLVGWVGYRTLARRWNLRARVHHREILGHVAGITGVINAVLLAFIVFAAWTYYDRAREAVDKETGVIWQVWNDIEASEERPGHLASCALSDSVQAYVSEELRDYVKYVSDYEWNEVAIGATWRDLGNDPASLHLRDAYEAVLQQEGDRGPHGTAEKAVVGGIVKRFNVLLDARQQRIAYGQEGAIQWVAWITLICGGALCLACCWLIGFEDAQLHQVVVLTVSTSLGLIVVLIVALNTPFKGINPIPNTRFKELSEQIQVWEDAERIEKLRAKQIHEQADP